ncbi:hypothetical protein FQN57_007064 [Myotisia sp. PD_48]|nr:hypothetical protein FQN57_007064 [Myotisia sp. PD_48]
MESKSKSTNGATSLFQVYLRLRPPTNSQRSLKQEDWLLVEPPSSEKDNGSPVVETWPTHITVQPPSDSRKRAVEKFAFTKVFEQQASQLDVFQESGITLLLSGVLQDKRDGLFATLGVTGSGKITVKSRKLTYSTQSHTILGSKSQRGITQMSLDVVYRSLGTTIIRPTDGNISPHMRSLQASDPSEAQISPAKSFLQGIYGDANGDRGRASRAQTPMVTGSRAHTPMDSFISTNTSRRPPPPRISILPQTPDTTEFIMPVNPNDEYVVLLSMYEVYNDRIFDLLSPINPSAGRATYNQKERRRPLFFKSTEASTDRKVVAGLQKIVCSTYEEAIMVLETGLMERRVTGTVSNSASSRSHGFFCVEIKKKVTDRRLGGDIWVGNTLTIVDLAGSERARNAKTAGDTLAEAGKINESLMYLGQCLQMQTNLQDGNKALVPFRQCKLTELLFSNSFPSNHGSASCSRHPQKAVMMVTADPLGDFNATSQILRYSALAREVTVPRIPSFTSTILSDSTNGHGQKFLVNGKTSLPSVSAKDLEIAALEIAQIADEYEALAVKLAEEEIARAEAEIKQKAAEDRCELVEQYVREECWEEMEQRLEVEKRRWLAAWDEQVTRQEDHLDKKIDILSRGIKIHEDPEPSAREKLDNLETENEALRRKITLLERELLSCSPVKKSKSKKNTIPGRFDSMDYNFIANGSGSDTENSPVRPYRLETQGIHY